MANETVDVPPSRDAKEALSVPAVASARQLPEGSRLLHIGQPHSGIVEIQKAAAARREALRDHGVVYPGADLDHSAATSTLIGPRSPAWTATRTLAVWDALRTEIETHSRLRALISDEHIAACDEDTARRFADELRGRLHVVITAQSLGSLLTSIWQRRVLNGHPGPYSKWLARALNSEGRQGQGEQGLPPEYDIATQVVLWTRVIGPARVHVVLVDDDDPTAVSDAFEAMLGLPTGALRPAPGQADTIVRTLAPVETNLLRRINGATKRADVAQDAYEQVVREGAVATLCARRETDERDGRLGVPPKHAAQLASDAHAFVDAAIANGIEVVGAIDRFRSPPLAPVASRSNADDRAEMAVSALRGAVSAALGRGIDFERPAPEPHPLGQEWSEARRGRDVLHIDLSSRRVIDCIWPASSQPPTASLVGGVARVVASSRRARWVAIEGYAMVDASLREHVFGALHDPKVIITVDADAERALWEQALALGETRDFSDWSVDGDALLADIADHAGDVSIIRADDEGAIRKAIQDHPAPMTWTPRESHSLKRPDVLVIRELNESLTDVRLQPFERLAVIGAGAMGGMRARRSRASNRPDSTARAIAGIAAMVGGERR